MLTNGLIKTPDSLTHKALAADDWTLEQHLLALLVDELAIANWQRSKDGDKPSKRPKPISPLAKKRSSTYGKTTRSYDEVAAFLRQLNPNQYR